MTKLPSSFRRDASFVTSCALLATALSAAYITFYLRGGPRIIDATSYYLEARAFAEGHLAFHLDEPVASTLGRFMVRTDAPDGARGAVIFPPGYPALLALGFLLGHPLVIGPLLAAAITCATFMLARAVVPDRLVTIASVPRLATYFSVVCLALRYHTADTMSHGLSALCFTASLAFALAAMRAIDDGRRASVHGVALGFFAGWLAATRPVSALALGVTLAFVLVPALRLRPRAAISIFASAVLGCLPGFMLLIAHQHAATGEWFTSSQTAYYAVADGPPGCFRYGFGENIGCVEEHGEFVRHNLPHGYGAYAATATTLRRLKQHLLDAGNSELFFLVLVAGFVLAWRQPRLRFLAVGVLAQIIAYVPFYFDGNYPGGGARFFADVLPLEHILIALAVKQFVERVKNRRVQNRRVVAFVLLAPLGFVVRSRFEHESLRDRDGGRPMFEASRLPNVNTPALLFIDTDHGFNLAFDPDEHRLNAKSSTTNQWSVVRRRGDALDLFAWQAHGKPPAYRYIFPFDPRDGDVRIEPWEPVLTQPLFIDAANLWPPIAQENGYVHLSWDQGFCLRTPGTREAVLVPSSPDKPATVTFSLPAPFLRQEQLAPVLDIGGHGSATIEWLVDGRVVSTEHLAFDDSTSKERTSPCFVGTSFMVPNDARTLFFRMNRDAGPDDGYVAVSRFWVGHPEKH